MQKRISPGPVVKNYSASDFISVIFYNGCEYKMAFKRADAGYTDQFNVFVFEKGRILDSMQLVKKSEGVWKASQPAPEWVLSNEDKLSMLIERYIGISN